MYRPTLTSIPTLVRVKPGALERLGIYLKRDSRTKPAIFLSKNLVPQLADTAARALRSEGIEPVTWIEIESNSIEECLAKFETMPSSINAVVGIGGGKALDVAKYLSFLIRCPYYAVPTSLSNDGFCSPQSSLTHQGKRRTFPASLPYAVIVDTAVCLAAPRVLTLSGIGDLVAKFTAVRDWKLSFHQTQEPVHDFAMLLSDGAIHAYLSHPTTDAEGIRLLATALMLNGIAMEVCGSSRPASGSEHLISHALDALSARPRLHGLQVGIATYIVSQLQELNTQSISDLFDKVRFWDAIADAPFSRSEWLKAVAAAPSIKPDYYTILSSGNILAKVESILDNDPKLKPCFVD